jgi:ketosteroid isomerase-like protein
VRRAAACAGIGFALLAAGCGGGGSKGGDPRTTVTRYLAALSRGDAAAACATFTPETRDKLAEFGAGTLKLHKQSCAATIGVLFGTSGGSRLRGLGRAKIVSVDQNGDKAQVRIAGVDATTQLVRDDGKWLISSEPSGETD